jgi:1-acyl-sn-glycerol-3-phosphate acyltransferase
MTESMPPIRNYPLYIHRVLMKWFSFFVFGLMAITLTVIVLPYLTLTVREREKIRERAHRIVSASFRWFCNLMYRIGIVEVDVDDRHQYGNLSSKIIVANHPSLIDVVMLLSLVPNADCIVNGYVERTIAGKIVQKLYILNSKGHERLLHECAESLKQGNCLVIFPEGTRTPRSGELRLKKGAARLALLSGCGIIPVHIGGTDKWGLGKHDPWTAFNHTEKWIYRIRMREEISPTPYMTLDTPRACKRLNDAIRHAIAPCPQSSAK